MIRRNPWLFKLNADYAWDASDFIAREISFDSPWLNIHLGVITVKQGYAWNGCSHKLAIADLWIIGIPDGRLHEGLPITYHASLIHDALTQFRATLPITHQQATAIFDALLKERRFFWRKLYVWAVSRFAPRGFKGNQAPGSTR